MAFFKDAQTMSENFAIQSTAVCDDLAAYACAGGRFDGVVVLGRVEHVGGGARQLNELDRVEVAGLSLVFHYGALVCGIDGDIVLFDVSAGTLKKSSVLQGHTDAVRCVAAHGDWLASGSIDRTVRIWSMTTRAELHCMRDHTDRVFSVCFSHNGRWLVSGSTDESVIVYDATRDFARHTTLTLHDWGNAVCFSPDDSLLAVGASGSGSAIYSVDAFEELRTLAGYHWVMCVAWLGNDAASLVGGTYDGSLVAWDAATGSVTSQEMVHDDVVNALSFTSSFRTLLTAGEDKTSRVFDVHFHHESRATAALYSASLLVFSALHRSPKLGNAIVMQRIAEAAAGDAAALAALSDAERTRIFTAARVSRAYRAKRLPTLEALGNYHARMHWLHTATPAYHEGVELKRLGPTQE